jgi:hypothetical protein
MIASTTWNNQQELPRLSTKRRLMQRASKLVKPQRRWLEWKKNGQIKARKRAQ